MTTATTIHMIRHGEVHNPNGIYYGRLPGFTLSRQGRRQATATANALREERLDALFTSPMERAVETAEIIADAQSGIPLRTALAITEVFSPFDGRPIDELAARNWDIYSGTRPPFEQPEDVLQRVRTFVNEVRRDHPGRSVALVSHGDVIMFMSLWANGLPLTPETKQAFHAPDYLGHASISTFTFCTGYEDERPAFAYRTTPLTTTIPE